MDENLMLAVETSSLRGSVALGRCTSATLDIASRRKGRAGGRRYIGPSSHVAWRALSAERKNAAELLPAIRELLAEIGAEPAEIGVVCFSQGPGSFTGLRVAATLARMWQSATGCRVVAVPTLEVVARNALALPDGPTRLAVIVDARRGQVFGALFERNDAGELRTVADAGLHDAVTWLASLERPCGVLGEGVGKHRQEVVQAGLEILPEETWRPDARQVLVVGRRLAAAGRFCTPEEILPAYLRPPECEEVYEQRRAEAQARQGA